ncbi:hypothetical protein QZH41_015658 [Actinostola sp. cb2023]|nr:hypothetical protein QZH41_015658 [Actinostola sp. cb2023]
MSSDSDISLSEQSEVDSEVNFQQNYVLESEDINSLVAEDLEHLHVGAYHSYQPYSDEPLADEDWLSEFYDEKEQEEERVHELQRRLDGDEAVSSWCQCGKCEITYLQSAKECCCCCQEIEQCVEALNNERVHKMVETIPPCITQQISMLYVSMNGL